MRKSGWSAFLQTGRAKVSPGFSMLPSGGAWDMSCGAWGTPGFSLLPSGGAGEWWISRCYPLVEQESGEFLAAALWWSRRFVICCSILQADRAKGKPRCLNNNFCINLYWSKFWCNNAKFISIQTHVIIIILDKICLFRCRNLCLMDTVQILYVWTTWIVIKLWPVMQCKQLLCRLCLIRIMTKRNSPG